MSDDPDREIFQAIRRRASAEAIRRRPLNERMRWTAQHFLGCPYQEHPLEQGAEESLTMSLASFDCFTLVETVLALARELGRRRPTWNSLTAEIRRLRYRRGRIAGYPSRLHFFTDWLRENGRRGVLADLSGLLGGVPCRKTLDWMTRHPESYPALRQPSVWRRMARIERKLSRIPLRYVPREALREREAFLRDGDILAVATALPGLDVGHLGMAFRERGRIRLLHASRRDGRVGISEETFYAYLGQRRDRSGFMAARPRDPFTDR